MRCVRFVSPLRWPAFVHLHLLRARRALLCVDRGFFARWALFVLDILFEMYGSNVDIVAVIQTRIHIDYSHMG